MRVLVLGATGFIGSTVCTRLAAAGHEVIGVSRRPPPAGLTPIVHVAFDVARASAPESWLSLLQGTGAVVNCAVFLCVLRLSRITRSSRCVNAASPLCLQPARGREGGGSCTPPRRAAGGAFERRRQGADGARPPGSWPSLVIGRSATAAARSCEALRPCRGSSCRRQQCRCSRCGSMISSRRLRSASARRLLPLRG